MNETSRLVVAIVVPSCFLGIYILLQLRLRRHALAKREWYRQNPDRFPSRRGQILRILPFMLVVAAATAWAMLAGRWEQVPLGVIALACFGYLLYQSATGRNQPSGE